MNEVYKVKWSVGKSNTLLSREKYFKGKDKAEDFAHKLRLAWARLEGISTDFEVLTIPYQLEDVK